jgi:hypothetical protein
VKLRKRDVPRAACKQIVHAKRNVRNSYYKKAAPLSLKGPVTSFVPSWLRFPTEQHGLAAPAPPLAEAKRFPKRAKNVASVGLSVQQSTSSGREGYIVHTRVFQFLRQLFLTSQVATLAALGMILGAAGRLLNSVDRINY